jgi:hypothetical protein
MLSDLDSDGDVEAHFASLVKGNVVPTGAIEAWTQISREHLLFRLAQLKCGRHIEGILRGQGRLATVRCVGELLRVLTDREASPYHERHFQRGMDKMRAHHRKACEVDMAALDSDERDWHLTRLQVQQMYLKSLERVSGRG